MQTHKTKAETLSWLAGQGFPVPELSVFSVESWENTPEKIVRSLYDRFGQYAPKLAVRSSARAEDGTDSSQAGAFRSVLHVPSDSVKELCRAICEVQGKLHSKLDQIFVQPMVGNVIMSGVLMTRHLDDGSPYYVINYDDSSGRTDTVTGGVGASKTVFIYKGVRDEEFDSPRLRTVVNLAQSLEKLYADAPLDIEFALDARLHVHLLQVRRICADRHW
jgi:phosphoenolpyruvate synthase/pyruvate phosphate dikinase